MNKEPGYVYILTNPSFREDWVKIGKSSRPVDVRSKELDNTAVPLPFEIFATMKTTKYNEAEKLVHRYIERFTNLRIRNNREFFNVQPEVALEIFKDVALVIEDAEIDEVYKKTVSGNITEKENRRERCSEGENRVWMIPCNSKFFDLRGCFAKFGEMYWSQYFNYHKGDTGYIYMSSPDSAIIFSIEIVDSELPYSPEMDFKEEFFVDKSDFHTWKAHNRFAHFRMTGETCHIGVRILCVTSRNCHIGVRILCVTSRNGKTASSTLRRSRSSVRSSRTAPSALTIPGSE